MNFAIKKEWNLEELEEQKSALEDRIRRLEADLKSPLDQDFHEQANQISQQLILKRLLEVERNHLKTIKFEIQKKQHS